MQNRSPVLSDISPSALSAAKLRLPLVWGLQLPGLPVTPLPLRMAIPVQPEQSVSETAPWKPKFSRFQSPFHQKGILWSKESWKGYVF